VASIGAGSLALVYAASFAAGGHGSDQLYKSLLGWTALGAALVAALIGSVLRGLRARSNRDECAEDVSPLDQVWLRRAWLLFAMAAFTWTGLHIAFA
jgi:hypothetical protein